MYMFCFLSGKSESYNPKVQLLASNRATKSRSADCLLTLWYLLGASCVSSITSLCVLSYQNCNTISMVWKGVAFNQPQISAICIWKIPFDHGSLLIYAVEKFPPCDYEAQITQIDIISEFQWQPHYLGVLEMNDRVLASFHPSHSLCFSGMRKNSWRFRSSQRRRCAQEMGRGRERKREERPPYFNSDARIHITEGKKNRADQEGGGHLEAGERSKGLPYMRSTQNEEGDLEAGGRAR